MFRTLLKNTKISAIAYFISGSIGLLLIPLLISTYGVSGLGLIMLLRLLLPTAGLGLFDFGISEIATQSISIARAKDQWPLAFEKLRILLFTTLFISVFAGLVVYSVSQYLPLWMHVPAEQSNKFIQITQATAMLLPLLFTGLLVEGVVKGFEQFKQLRATEISTTFGYAVGSFICIQYGFGFGSIAWMFLLSLSLRAIVVAYFAIRQLNHHRSDVVSAPKQAINFVVKRGQLLFFSRVLGTFQHQFPLLLIGLLIGPTAVGIYDSLMRLPRFVKSVLSLINSTLLPVAARLDASDDLTRLRLLGTLGLSLLPALIIPPLAVTAIFSNQVLFHWLGQDFVQYGPWLAMLWIVPAINTIYSFHTNLLLTRLEFLRANNKIASLQVLLQLTLSLILVGYFNLLQNAFILSQVILASLAFMFQIKLSVRQLSISRERTIRLVTFLLIFLASVGTIRLWSTSLELSNLWLFFAVWLGGSILSWLISAYFLLTPADRNLAKQIARSDSYSK